MLTAEVRSGADSTDMLIIVPQGDGAGQVNLTGNTVNSQVSLLAATPWPEWDATEDHVQTPLQRQRSSMQSPDVSRFKLDD